MRIKRRLIVVVNKDEGNPEKVARDCMANVTGLACLGTKACKFGIMVKLAHENFPTVVEASDYSVCFLDIRDARLDYYHYPSWHEMAELYGDPSYLRLGLDEE
jgi:hypothetical protein